VTGRIRRQRSCSPLLSARTKEVQMNGEETEDFEPRYPDISVQLTGEDGNAFAILGRTQHALRRAGVSHDEIQAYLAEATSGDYDHLLQTTMRWVDAL
jgi:hypothetical protein